MIVDLPKRKPARLKNFDYSTPGAYFVTICVKDRKNLLSHITVGDGVLDVPINILSKYGQIADRYINSMDTLYNHISVDKYVIMPNHIHLLIRILDTNNYIGSSGTPNPTNSVISKFVSTLKRMCNREYGKNIWQRLSNDHIIRNTADYNKIWNYIDTNVLRWELDCFYTEN